MQSLAEGLFYAVATLAIIYLMDRLFVLWDRRKKKREWDYWKDNSR